MKKKNPRPETYHEGANDERSAWLAKFRRWKAEGATEVNIDSVIEWGLQRNERYRAKKGGL